MIITNNSFTNSAINLADSNDVELLPFIKETELTSVEVVEVYDLARTYGVFTHELPSNDDYYAYMGGAYYEKQYSNNIVDIEKYYQYLRNKKLEKYKPTNSYHSTSMNFFYGIDDTMNRSFEDFVLKMLKNFLSDGIFVESTRFKSDKDVLVVFFRNKSGTIDPIQLRCSQAHFNFSGSFCSYETHMIDDSSFSMTVTKRKSIDVNQEYQKYIKYKSQYYSNKVNGHKIYTYSDGYFSKNYFIELEKNVFEQIGYFLLFIQRVLPVEYIMEPIKLLSTEYSQHDGRLRFFYYATIDLRFFKDLRYIRERKLYKISDNNNTVFVIKASVFIDDYSIIKRELSYSNYISPSDMSVEFFDKESFFKLHNPPLAEGLSHVHPHRFVALTDYDKIEEELEMMNELDYLEEQDDMDDYYDPEVSDILKTEKKFDAYGENDAFKDFTDLGDF